MERNLTKMSSELGALFNDCSPQVVDGSLQWYLAGSLATMITGDALELSEVILDENNSIISTDEKIVLTELDQNKIKAFERQIGSDVDIVNVNGGMYYGASLDKKPSIAYIKDNISDISELIPSFKYIGGTAYIDNLDREHDIDAHHVTKVVTSNGEIFVTSLPEQIAYKLNDLLVIYGLSLNNNSDSVQKHYEKDIRDILFMIYGYKDLYPQEVYLKRIPKALNYELDEEIISGVLASIKGNEGFSDVMNESISFLENMMTTAYEFQKQSKQQNIM